MDRDFFLHVFFPISIHLSLDTRHSPFSLDHLIRALEHAYWYCQTNLFCRLEVDDELKLRRLLYGQVGRFRSPENLVYVVGGPAEQIFVVHPRRT
jgi:hypothetical protein